jgi:hypothetical protein
MVDATGITKLQKHTSATNNFFLVNKFFIFYLRQFLRFIQVYYLFPFHSAAHNAQANSFTFFASLSGNQIIREDKNKKPKLITTLVLIYLIIRRWPKWVWRALQPAKLMPNPLSFPL